MKLINYKYLFVIILFLKFSNKIGNRSESTWKGKKNALTCTIWYCLLKINYVRIRQKKLRGVRY